MQAGPPGGPEAGAQGLLGEGVGEGVTARFDLADDGGLGRAVEQVEQAVLVLAGDGRQEVEVELAAHHGGHGQDGAGALRQARHTLADDLPDRLGEPLVGQVTTDPPVAVLLVHGPRVQQVAQQLAEEVRVAVGLTTYVVGQGHARPVELVAGRPLHVGHDVPVVETRQGEALHAGQAVQLGEDVGQGVVGREVGLAVVADDEQAGVARAVRQVPEQAQGRLVGPLEVVEHEQDRCLLGHLGEHSVHRGIQEVAVGIGVGGRGRELGEPPLQAGQQAHEACSVAVDVGLQVRFVGVRHVVTQGLHEGLVGDAHVLVAASVEDYAAGLVAAAADLAGEGRLAHPRLAGHQEELPSLAGVHGLPGLLGDRDHLVPTEEAHPGRGLEALGQGDAPGETGRR